MKVLSLHLEKKGEKPSTSSSGRKGGEWKWEINI